MHEKVAMAVRGKKESSYLIHGSTIMIVSILFIIMTDGRLFASTVCRTPQGWSGRLSILAGVV